MHLVCVMIAQQSRITNADNSGLSLIWVWTEVIECVNWETKLWKIVIILFPNELHMKTQTYSWWHQPKGRTDGQSRRITCKPYKTKPTITETMFQPSHLRSKNHQREKDFGSWGYKTNTQICKKWQQFPWNGVTLISKHYCTLTAHKGPLSYFQLLMVAWNSTIIVRAMWCMWPALICCYIVLWWVQKEATCSSSHALL